MSRQRDGSLTPEYRMWLQAKHRAKIRKIPFAIDLSDIVIPEICPLLNIPLVHGKIRMNFNSPQLDRIIPDIGYVKGNVQVLSMKANMAKSRLTLSEMKLLVKNWEAQKR